MAALTYEELIETLRRGERRESAAVLPEPQELTPKPAECGAERSEKSLGGLNDCGEAVITLAELPGLEERLRASGWKVERVGDELRCWTGRWKPKWKM
jgi:hypothetical protein